MKITEKTLLDNYDGITNGLNYISEIGGIAITWNYRRGVDSDGFNPVCTQREDASEISLEYDRSGTIDLDGSCADHPTLIKMYGDIAKTVGNEA